jgi:vacuolar-type H+-ATPase subunit I/STV1
MAVLLALWLGFITERAGSALPAVSAHVINNMVFTVLTATVGTPLDRALNMTLLMGAAVVFFGCVLWIWRLSVPSPRT